MNIMTVMAVVMAGCDVVKLLYSGKEVKQACKEVHCKSRNIFYSTLAMQKL